MQLCRIIYYSLAARHVSSDIFVHHQEHLNCITASGITHVCRCQLALSLTQDALSLHHKHLVFIVTLTRDSQIQTVSEMMSIQMLT
jgi:hypothetical protein